MKEITLLHIGDIHYEKIEGERGSVDLKDSRFPSNLTPYLASGNRKLVNRNLTKEINEDPSAILISGDLSTYGEIEGYKE